MLFAVLFEDDANRADDISRKHMPAHLEFLERNASVIRAAGPLRDADDTPAGGLWVVQADDREQVETLVQVDPLWLTGLRRSVRVLAWTQVFADGARGGRQD